MYSFAAVGLDAARVADQAFKTGCVEDCHVQRIAAVRMVHADILHLLQCTTPYTLATMYSEVLAQLVFLRLFAVSRGLQRPACLRKRRAAQRGAALAS